MLKNIVKEPILFQHLSISCKYFGDIWETSGLLPPCKAPIARCTHSFNHFHAIKHQSFLSSTTLPGATTTVHKITASVYSKMFFTIWVKFWVHIILMDYTASARCLYTVERLEAEVTSKQNEIGPDDPITTKSQVIQSENTFGELYACMMPCLRTKLIWLCGCHCQANGFHSFILIPAFRVRRVAGKVARRGLEIHNG